jgi:hypothetical protein
MIKWQPFWRPRPKPNAYALLGECGDRLDASWSGSSLLKTLVSRRVSKTESWPKGCHMEPEDLLRMVASICENLHIQYFVTGSTATIVYGEPRFTNDIDTVVELPTSKAQAFCEMFDRKEFYLSEAAVLSAIKQRSQFNLIHPGSGLKVNFMVAAETDLNRSRMSRARDLPVLEGRTVKFASAEDAILMKLKYYQEGQSDKHIRDILSVLKIQNERIDYQYLDHWAGRLGVTTEWKRVLQGTQE